MQEAHQAIFRQIQQNYQQSPRPQKVNFLVIGNYGTGKTTLARTCPMPVLMHVFDPGGEKVRFLQPLIESGQIMVETFIDEDPKDPSAVRRWENRVDELRKANVFESLGTYIVDSLTTMSDCIMNAVLADSKRPGTVPQMQDYLKQQIIMRNAIDLITGVPCHTLCTGHIALNKDEVTGRILAGLLMAGKQSAKLPLLFDEVYVTDVVKKGKETEYHLVTGTIDYYHCRSRIGAGTLDLYEAPDISYILRKVSKDG